MSETWRQIAHRSLKFYAVGGVGIAVQLGSLALYAGVFRLNYLLATGLAVETAVLHNFVWHERWTWRDHNVHNPGGVLGRLVRFNLTNGALSLVGNLILMRIFVGIAHLHYFIASLLSVASCSLLQFIISHYYIFRAHRVVNDKKGEHDHLSAMQT